MRWRCLAVGCFLILAGCATTTRPGVVGVVRSQFMIVSAATVDHLAAIQYLDEANKARAQGVLVSQGSDYQRLQRIVPRLIAQTGVFRDDAPGWPWALALIRSDTINAMCAPGGKITVYTGLIDRLNLTDDEIAAVLGHEMAHALREHGREKVSQAVAQKALIDIAMASTRNRETQIALANQMVTYIYSLPNSRQQETEADEIGVELAARAGYDPRAALTLWKKMESTGSSPPEFLSTHPAYATRYEDLRQLMPKVLPLYEAADKP